MRRKGERDDGVAIYVRDSSVKVNKALPIEFDDLIDRTADVLLKSRLRKENLGIMAIVEKDGREFCVTTNHLHWNPALSDVKLCK